MKNWLIFILFFLVQGSFGQGKFLSVEAVQDSVSKSPKSVLLFVHTDWCTYCGLQKAQLDKSKIESDKVYFADFDAEYREEVKFKGKSYLFKPTGRNTGVHELVHFFVGNKKSAFPLWVLLNDKLDVLDTYSGYLKPREIEKIMDSLVSL